MCLKNSIFHFYSICSICNTRRKRKKIHMITTSDKIYALIMLEIWKFKYFLISNWFRYNNAERFNVLMLIYRTGWRKKSIHFFITWDPVNRFQCSIPCFEGHLMPFKMRYKEVHNYFPIKFYRSNSFGLIWPNFLLVLRHAWGFSLQH